MDGDYCGDCGEELDEPEAQLDPSKRKPCPSCGSLRRHFSRSIFETLTPVGDVATARVVKPPLLENPPTLYPTEVAQDDAKWIRLQYIELESPPFGEAGVMVYVFGPSWQCRGFGIGKTPEDALWHVITELWPG